MSQRFAVVHEAEADFQTATDLADRVFVEAINWLEEDAVAYHRDWLAHEPGGRRLLWKTIPLLAREAGIRAHGHFPDGPGLPDAAAARRAILYLRFAFPNLDAVVLIRDGDDQSERREGLDQACRQERGRSVIVVGFAIVERESWVICGYEPQDETESARLVRECQLLGFDPRFMSHELTACKDDHAKHSPKRVLRELSGNNRDREGRCWKETPLNVLRNRGGGNGLAAYLLEVRERLAPMIGHIDKE